MAKRLNRSFRMEVRLSNCERAEIDRRARTAGVPVSKFVRHAALSIELPARRTNVEVEAVAALNRVGVNLNQIARIGNRSRSLSAADVRLLSVLTNEVAEAVSAIQQGATL
ncbi:plasmid mobilization protein [Leisingera caerulea]|uniref:plasmid mobilization protein n=1 Tax=Leisingera caerulea TaxID=506591 RepID=UPI0021A6C195|nr:plasmid mobilization relaxosome protein MobC [Leisingera caerulea]UWQ83528.1 plasmid mobilization relaxosome protein MobC [Leisingera caerulea]